jgi:hypothetical protein
VEAAQPQVPAPWAKAVDAALRLIPACIKDVGEGTGQASKAVVELLWRDGCGSVFSWAEAHKRRPAGKLFASLSAATHPLAAVHARACRLVHWLRAQPDGGTSLLERLARGERGGWRLLTELLEGHLALVRTSCEACVSVGAQTSK